MEKSNEQNGVPGSEKGTPSDVHRCKILLIGRLHDQLVHLTIHRKWNGLLGHKPPKFIPHIFQNTGGGVGDICMSAAL
jgi:hypothetical protein